MVSWELRYLEFCKEPAGAAARWFAEMFLLEYAELVEPTFLMSLETYPLSMPPALPMLPTPP